MKLPKLLFTFILLFNCLLVLSQENHPEIYLDENLKAIDFVEFYKKQSSFLFYKRTTKKDSLTINRLYENYKFGKFSDTEMSQIKLLIARDTDLKIPITKTIIISYRDTLYGLNELNNHFKKATERPKEDYTIKKYLKRRKKNDEDQKECYRKFKRLEIEPIYLYSYNANYSFSPKNYKWKKASPALKKIFLNGDPGRMIIVKPNGEYFCYFYLFETHVKKLLKKKNWSRFFHDYKIAKDSLLVTRNGFFQEIAKAPKENTKSFYIEKNSRNRGSYSKNKIKLPAGTIRVKNRSEINIYLNNLPKCYSYGSY